jgi:hypothetical protein
MADLFTVTAPLKIRLPDGRQQVIAELFRHPAGLLYFEMHWQEDRESRIHLVEGELKGDGPWKIADHIIYVLGCQHTDAEMAYEYAEWQTWHQQHPEACPDRKMISRIASSYGVIDCK